MLTQSCLQIFLKGTNFHSSSLSVQPARHSCITNRFLSYHFCGLLTVKFSFQSLLQFLRANFITNLCYSDLLKIKFSSLTASRTAYSFLSGHPVVACLYWHTQSYVAMVVMTFTYRSMGTDTGCATSALYWVSDVVINDFISMARGCNEQSQYRVKCYRKNM